MRMGATPESGGIRFHVWAPAAETVEIIAEGGGNFPLAHENSGTFSGLAPMLKVGDLYRYRIDGKGPFPDPVSRFQPQGVHGPSEIVDSTTFAWTDAGWTGVDPADLVIYELHVGTFTPEGTIAAASAKLKTIADLGVTAIELMPVNDFPGERGWGYDGVAQFAPARCYGTPDDLRRLVDQAHSLGLAVLLDVVYNHFGPDGNYLTQFSAAYFNATRSSPWGPAVNLDGRESRPVREFLISNAMHWIDEYHMDGLRLDATHHLHDDGPRHLLAELTARVHAAAPDRHIHLIAEDPRNLSSLLIGETEGGAGLDAVWSDDFHHQFRRYLVGDSEGVFRDFRGSLGDLATTMNRGWLFQGEYSTHREYHRGTSPDGLKPRQFVFCIQNHDRIGNRAFGERLHHQIDLASYRAASAVLLLSAATPLLFMGQEWAASSPFLFFTDHKEALGDAIREGRRREFRHYAEFADEASHARLPDVQAVATFLRCKLDWAESAVEPHAGMLRLYRALLQLRRTEPVLRANWAGASEAVALDEKTLVLARRGREDSSLVLVARWKAAGVAELPPDFAEPIVVLTTEDPAFTVDPMPPSFNFDGHRGAIRFSRPSAVLLRVQGSAKIISGGS